MGRIHACLAAQYVVDASEEPSSAIFIGTYDGKETCRSPIALTVAVVVVVVVADSEGSFMIERVASMAEHFIQDFRRLSTKQSVSHY